MYNKFLKRGISLILAIILFPIILIFYIFVGIAIKIEDRGPILFSQKRLGKDGNIFNMYKFRSMKVNCADIRNRDGSTYNSACDSRVTNIGKFIRCTSIDEIPQLINILKGDMSFIGPRPDLEDHYKLYTIEERSKLNCRPGITGYNQVYYRNSVIWKDRLKNDLYYVNNVSFLLDMRILRKTLAVLLTRKGVYNVAENGTETDQTEDISI